MNPKTSALSAPAGDSGPGGSGPRSSGTLAETKQPIAQAAREMASKVKSAASDTVAKAKAEAERVVTEKKETAANRLGGYSSAIRDTAKSMEEKSPNIAWFTERAADKLQGVADYMRNRDLAGLRGDCENFARRNPALFFGGMFFAGLLVGNRLKASRRKYDGDGNYDRQAEPEWEEGRAGGFEPDTGLSDAERDAASL